MTNDRIDRETLLSQTINWLRFPFIIMVIFIHSPGIGELPNSVDVRNISSLSSVDYWNLMRIALSSVLPRIAVPGFFLISGYLFFRKCSVWNKDAYVKQLKKRFHTLFIPYVLWNCICLIIPILMFVGLGLHNPIYNESLHQYTESVDWLFWIWDYSTINSGGVNFFGIWHDYTYPINIPLWYIRDLIVICILSPMIYFLIKRMKLSYIITLLLLYLFDIWPNIHGFSSVGMLYFSIGAYLAINKINILAICRKVEIPCYLLTIALACILIPNNNNITIGCVNINSFYIFTGVISAFNIVSRLLSSNKISTNKWISDRYFFIYAFHGVYFVLYCTELVFPYSLNRSITYRFIEYLTTPFIKIVICLIIFELMRKIAPKLLSILTGGR